MRKELLFVFGVMICMVFTQCQETDLLSGNETISYEENTSMEGIPIPEGGIEKEIMLWGNPAHVIETEDSYIFQHDIKLNKREIDSINSLPDTRAALVQGRVWTHNLVYYKIGAGLAYPEYVTQAMRHIENSTYIKFIEASTGISNYVEIIKVPYGEGVYSDYIGKKGGRQIVALDGRESVGNVIHELCHVLGLYHEQCREDRDNHIIVNYDVMTSSSERYQYLKYSDRWEAGYDFLNFDFNSIMLYPSQLKPDGFTMVRRDNNLPFAAQREGLSGNDILALKDKYPFERIEISKPTIPLEGILHVTTTYTFKATGYGKNVKYNWTFKDLKGTDYLINGDKNFVPLYLVRDPTLTKTNTPETYVVYVECPEIYKSGSVIVDVPSGYILTDTPRTLPQRPRVKEIF